MILRPEMTAREAARASAAGGRLAGSESGPGPEAALRRPETGTAGAETAEIPMPGVDGVLLELKMLRLDLKMFRSEFLSVMRTEMRRSTVRTVVACLLLYFALKWF